MASRRGFTLLEMSVVLIVIGLIVGGIVAGRQVIRNAQLQSIIADVNKYKAAAKQFRDKYTFLPGDLPNATTFWGSDGAGCPQGDTASTTPRVTTCNGDGNGKVAASVENDFPNAGYLGANGYESLHAWQHLSNAGLIADGPYSGVPYSSNYKPGVNIPVAKTNSTAGFIFFYAAPISSGGTDPLGNSIAYVYPGSYGHIIEYGGNNITSYPVSETLMQNYVLTPADALTIDTKIDDGMPSKGNVLSFTTNASGNPNCNDASTPPLYKLTQTGIVCTLIFLTGL